MKNYTRLVIFIAKTNKNEEVRRINNSIPVIHLAIPSRWITQHLWRAGRYNENSYEAFRQQNLIDDVKWCKENGKSIAPNVFPGFSWHNMKDDQSI